MLLENRVALITGSSRGLGKAIALALARQGATVVVNYRSQSQAAEAVREELEAAGSKVVLYQADVSDSSQAQDLIRGCIKQFGRLDILVNNAGINRDGLLMRMSDANWRDVIAASLDGTFNCTRAASRTMLKQRWGRIINICSVAGLTGNAGQSNYCAAKAGVIGFTRAAARELAPRGITVNAIAPGLIATGMAEDMPAAAREELLTRVPMGRMGREEEVTATVSFLASEAAGYITGQVLVVDGGMLA